MKKKEKPPWCWRTGAAKRIVNGAVLLFLSLSYHIRGAESMAGSGKYFYIRLKDNFFEDEAIIFLEGMPDGYLYIDILLKLYLKSLKNGGRLMVTDTIPYTLETLARATRHQVGTVEKALKAFRSLGLIETTDSGAIYMSNIQEYIGRSSDEADRKRAYRDRIDAEKNSVNSLPDKCPNLCPTDIELKLEKEKEKNTLNTLPIPATSTHDFSLIEHFFARYKQETGKEHEPVSRQKKEELLKQFADSLLGVGGEYFDEFLDEYFGVDGKRGLCGDSDKKIFHAFSPGVLKIVSDRWT